jgi:hypothetical protein
MSEKKSNVTLYLKRIEDRNPVTGNGKAPLKNFDGEVELYTRKMRVISSDQPFKGELNDDPGLDAGEAEPRVLDSEEEVD